MKLMNLMKKDNFSQKFNNSNYNIFLSKGRNGEVESLNEKVDVSNNKNKIIMVRNSHYYFKNLLFVITN